MKAIAGRTASDVASAYLKCMRVTGAKKYIFWVDNCGGKNKNWFLLIILLKVVNNKEWDIEQITIKYLEVIRTCVRILYMVQ